MADVIYSLHCFTRGMENEPPDPALLYGDTGEPRIFDFRRYELSRRLPEIIGGRMTRKCFQTDRGNFFTVEIIDDTGDLVEYEMYFTASKSSRRKDVINLFVQ